MAESYQPSGIVQRFCTNCGAQMERDSSFCAVCGTAVERGMQPADPADPWAPAAQSSVEYMGFWIRVGAEIVDSIFLIIALVVLVPLIIFAWWLLIVIIFTFPSV